jgi:folate-dependent phosphoribosylglycinamide formyltransferase PurN
VDDEFAGEMQQFLYESHPDWIAGSVISSSPLYKKSRIGASLFVLRRSGFIFLTEMIRIKLVRGFLDRKQKVFPSQLARDHNVELLVSSDINDEQSVTTLRRWQPDLIISTNFSHYIGKTVRETVARYGCWNLHKSLLPQYRGMAPSFHALLEGATKVGATLHVVAKGIDVGDVLTQVEVFVSETDSVYSLNRKTAKAGGRLLASFLENYDPMSVKATPQPDGAWRSYTYPSHAEVRAFRKKGLKFYASGSE